MAIIYPVSAVPVPGAHVAPESYVYPLGHPLVPCARPVVAACACCAAPMCGHEV